MDWGATMRDVLLVGGGAVSLQILKYIADFLKGALGRKRTELDRLGRELSLAIAERDRERLLRQKITELYYTLRGMMVMSGHWKIQDLPDIETEAKE